MNPTLTADAFFDGRIRVRQYRDGYRFSVDSVILAHHVAAAPAERFLDLGTGCGIMPLIIAVRNPNASVTGIEIQEDLADLAAANVLENRLTERIGIRHLDMTRLARRDVVGPVDMVFSNPPYRRMRSGRMNPNRQKAAARHEIHATLTQVVATAARMLDLGGRFALVYSAERLAELLSELRGRDLEPKWLRAVHSRAAAPAKLVLVEALKGGRSGMTVGPPLVVYKADGDYTAEVSAMFTLDGSGD